MSVKKSRMEAEKKAKAERVWNFEFVIIDEDGEQGGGYPATTAEAVAAFEKDIKFPGVIEMTLYREGKAIRRYRRADPLAQTPSP